MSGKAFHLRWNNHLQNLRSLFDVLFNQQNLVDVTISCQGGILKAHKIILSACSPYFENIFSENPCKHPVIILKEISIKEMHVLLEYMYKGEIDVSEDDLESLINTAAELEIRGLVNGFSKEQRKCMEESDQSCDGDNKEICEANELVEDKCEPNTKKRKVESADENSNSNCDNIDMTNKEGREDISEPTLSGQSKEEDETPSNGTSNETSKETETTIETYVSIFR